MTPAQLWGRKSDYAHRIPTQVPPCHYDC